MTQQVYKKVGRRYLPIGYSDGWVGFPTEGLWLVTSGDGKSSEECIIKIDELKHLKPAANLIYQYKDKIIKYLCDNDGVQLYGESYNKLVSKMLKEICKDE